MSSTSHQKKEDTQNSAAVQQSQNNELIPSDPLNNNTSLSVALPQDLLGPWLKTQDEVDMIIAHTHTPRIAALTTMDAREQVVDILGRWRIHLGLPAGDSVQQTELSVQLLFMANYLVKHFKDLTVSEIERAMELSICGALPTINNITYGNGLNNVYVSNILNAYKDMVASKITKIMQAQAMEKRKQEKIALSTPAVRCAGMKDFLKEQHSLVNAGKEIEDPFNICYNFLHETKRMIIAGPIINEALTYGKEKAAGQALEMYKKPLNKAIDGALKQFKNDKDNPVVKRFARNFCVQRFFKEIIHFEDLLNSIKESEFNPEQNGKD